MHVLHRPHLHLPQAVMVTVIAAVLAIAVTLMFASAVNDSHGSPSGASAPSPIAPAVRIPAVGPVWNHNPFAQIFRAPVVEPWKQG